MLETIADPNLTDKFTSHKYLETYNKLLPPIKNKVKNVLEIGIWLGGSILMWHDFFVNATIYGVDITEAPDFLKKERIITHKTNAYDINYIQSNYIDKNIKFDLIIDDGPHSLESMKFCAAHYSQLLTYDGLMIIEDIPYANWCPQIIASLPHHLQNKTIVIDLSHIQPRWDDRLLIIQS